MPETIDVLYSACAVMQTLQLQIPFMRGFWRSKSAFADATTVHHYLHQPFTLMRAYAQKARLIGFSWATHVLQVAKTVNLSQICKTVVLFVTVNVVDVLRWPFSGHVQPRQTMRQPFLVVNGNSPVAHICRASRAAPDQIGAAVVASPSKLACRRVVGKHGSDMFSRSHDLQFTMRGAA